MLVGPIRWQVSTKRELDGVKSESADMLKRAGGCNKQNVEC